MAARKKTFARSRDQIRPLAEGLGACFATDEIMVKGRRVGFAYREAPERKEDSGWRFVAGDESAAYMADPANLGLYDVNTVANYDPEIVGFLGAKVGSAFARESSKQEFVRVRGEGFDFIFVGGTYEMTDAWSIALPSGTFKRRFEEGSLVIWRRGLTAWITAWGNPRDESAEARLAAVRARTSPEAFDPREGERDGLRWFSYRLKEQHLAPALYGFVAEQSGHVQLAIYFDQEETAATGYEMIAGVRKAAGGS
jgi:hypothetical protein